MFNTRGGTIITKSARAVIAAGKKFCSSYSIHNPNDMANIANARRNMDDYMRRIEIESDVNKKEEDKKNIVPEILNAKLQENPSEVAK